MCVDLSNYDFVDFGSGWGGCIDFALIKLGGKRGLGIELNKGRADKLTEKGYSCINADVTTTKLPKKSVRFVTMSHFLEHLDCLEKALCAVELAMCTATDFVFIEGPNFDHDVYLKDQGFKFLWSDGHGHTLHITTLQLKHLFINLNLDFTLQVEKKYITDSLSPDVHPLASPKSQQQYDPKIHPPKRTAVFKKQLYRSFIFLVWLKRIENREKLLRSRVKFHTIQDMYRF